MTIFEGALTQVAYCWLVERRDGAGLALTSHDRPLKIDGVNYLPSPGMTPKSMRFESGTDPDDFEVEGKLSSNGLTKDDLASGMWDGARVQLFAVDWSNPNGGRVDQFEGEMGEVSSRGGEYSVALRGSAARLDVPASPETAPLCRARFGDRHCRVDLAGRTMISSVAFADGAAVTLDDQVGDSFLFGTMRVTDGPLRNFRTSILAVNGSEIFVRDVPATVFSAGDRIELRQGCDKRFSTCRDRFANTRNFRGEPHLPGTDILTRYPGG